MAIIDLYSKRRKRELETGPEVFKYDEIPATFRNQVLHILWDAVGPLDHLGRIEFYSFLTKSLAREYGKLGLVDRHHNESSEDILREFFLSTCDEKVLDVIELSFGKLLRDSSETSLAWFNHLNARIVVELNHRFYENQLGYQFEKGFIVRTDSKLLHAGVTKPALILLSASHFAGADQEFRSAHEHYRHQRYKECLNDCLKSFESVMKAICEKRGWEYEPDFTAKKLINVMFKNGLIPHYLESYFSGLESVLANGVPTVRNKKGAHGQGVEPVEVPAHLAAYALHLTASNILFLAEAEHNLVEPTASPSATTP